MVRARVREHGVTVPRTILTLMTFFALITNTMMLKNVANLFLCICDHLTQAPHEQIFALCTCMPDKG